MGTAAGCSAAKNQPAPGPFKHTRYINPRLLGYIMLFGRRFYPKCSISLRNVVVDFSDDLEFIETPDST